MWLFYALVSAVFAAVRRTNEKQLSHKLHSLTIGWAIQLTALPILFAMLLITGSWLNPLQLGWQFWLPTLGVIIGFYPLNNYLYINALRQGELSRILPLQSLSPIFSLLLGLVFLHQVPKAMALPGIVLIIIGIVVLTAVKGKLHAIIESRASLLFIGCVLMGVLVGLIDVYAIRASNPVFYAFISTAGAAVIQYSIARQRRIRERPALRSSAWQLLIAGSLFGASYCAFALAIASGPLGYVTAVRSSGIIIGATLGFIYLKEKVTARKVVALGLVSTGVVLLGLLG